MPCLERIDRKPALIWLFRAHSIRQADTADASSLQDSLSECVCEPYPQGGATSLLALGFVVTPRSGLRENVGQLVSNWLRRGSTPDLDL